MGILGQAFPNNELAGPQLFLTAFISEFKEKTFFHYAPYSPRLTIQANGNIRLLQSKLSIDLKAMHGL